MPWVRPSARMTSLSRIFIVAVPAGTALTYPSVRVLLPVCALVASVSAALETHAAVSAEGGLRTLCLRNWAMPASRLWAVSRGESRHPCRVLTALARSSEGMQRPNGRQDGVHVG
jgi:hypothetical protein